MISDFTALWVGDLGELVSREYLKLTCDVLLDLLQPDPFTIPAADSLSLAAADGLSLAVAV